MFMFFLRKVKFYSRQRNEKFERFSFSRYFKNFDFFLSAILLCLCCITRGAKLLLVVRASSIDTVFLDYM